MDMAAGLWQLKYPGAPLDYLNKEETLRRCLKNVNV
jgi:hypothetical protein